jgi:drug/metabolite transporter (DMT)-like permease
VTDDRKPRLDGLALGLLLLCTGLWGLGQVAAKVTLVEVPPLLQAGVRSLGAAALLLAWSAWRGLPLWQRDGTLRGGLLAGALFAAEFACIYIGLQYTSASRMSVFIYLSPFVVALGMPLISASERLSRGQLAALAVAFGGVALAFAEGFTRPAVGPQQWLGDALGLAAALLWGLTTLVLRGSRLTRALPEKTLLYQLVVSGVALTAAGFAAGEAWPARISAAAAWPLAFQTVVITFASYLVWFWLLRHYPATRLAAFTLLTPVFGLLAGAILLGEPVTARLLLALAAVCSGIALVNLLPAPHPAPRPAPVIPPPPKETST